MCPRANTSISCQIAFCRHQITSQLALALSSPPQQFIQPGQSQAHLGCWAAEATGNSWNFQYDVLRLTLCQHGFTRPGNPPVALFGKQCSSSQRCRSHYSATGHCQGPAKDPVEVCNDCTPSTIFDISLGQATRRHDGLKDHSVVSLVQMHTIWPCEVSRYAAGPPSAAKHTGSLRQYCCRAQVQRASANSWTPGG